MRNQNRLFLWQLVAIPVLALSLLAACCGCSGTSSAPGSLEPAANSAPDSMWTNANPTGSVPQPRDAHWITYDSTTGEVILFGGKGTRSHYFNDIWAYTPATNTWARLQPAGILPPGRFGHSMIYDPAARKLLVFGGVLGTTGQPANDLWAYSFQANAWTRLHPPGAAPAARVYPSMVYDPVTRQAILFGGWTGTNAFADTWTYDPATSTWRKLRTTGSPQPRWGASMVLDSATGKLILFGGLFGSYDGSNRLNDTWQYDPATNTWKNLSPAGPLPPARGYASMVYDSAAGKVLLSAGFAGSQGLLADTWEYDPSANAWHRLPPGATNPSRRDFSSAVYAQQANRTILFGGQTGNTGNVNATDLNDTWHR